MSKKLDISSSLMDSTTAKIIGRPKKTVNKPKETETVQETVKTSKADAEGAQPQTTAPETDQEETKSKRLNLLVYPSVYEEFKKLATMEQTSVNDLINQIMEETIEDNQESIDLYNRVFENKDDAEQQ